MPTQPESPNSPAANSLSQLARSMFAGNNSTILLAAVVSLLLVILFVLLLHVYAKWFFLSRSQSHSQSHRHRRRTPATTSGFPASTSSSSPFTHISIEASSSSSPVYTKGLDSAMVSTIPTFVSEYEEEDAEELECVICLSVIEEGEIGRRLTECGHAFHVECIDMWLSSHCNCPLCRTPVFIVQKDSQVGSVDGGDDDGGGGGGGDHGVVEIVIGATSSYEVSESERGDENFGGSVSETETSLSLLGFSFKRILSKVFLSSHVNELDDSQ